MKTYKVVYTRYDNSEWKSDTGEDIVEANSSEEAKKKLEDLSDICTYEYIVSSVYELI